MERHSTVEIRRSGHPTLDCLESVISIGIKDGAVVKPAQLRAVQLGITGHNAMRHGSTATEYLGELLTVPPDGQLYLFGQGIYHGRSHTMQPASSLIYPLFKFAARVRNSQDDRRSRQIVPLVQHRI